MNRALPILAFVLLLAALSSLHGLKPPAPPAHYAFGRGPDVVLVHGLGSRQQHWLPAARRLARRFRVTLVELPDRGPALSFSLEEAAVALDRTIAASAGGPVILVGHSLGGLVAAAHALRHPERVRGLVLVETALRPRIDGARLPDLLRRLDRDGAGVVRATYLGLGRDSAQGERLHAEVAGLDPETVRRWIRTAWTADLSSQMRKLQPAMLAVLAPRSWEPGQTWSEAAAALGYSAVPRVRPLRLEACGHFVMLDRPEALAEIIARFAENPDGEPVAGR